MYIHPLRIFSLFYLIMVIYSSSTILSIILNKKKKEIFFKENYDFLLSENNGEMKFILKMLTQLLTPAGIKFLIKYHLNKIIGNIFIYLFENNHHKYLNSLMKIYLYILKF